MKTTIETIRNRYLVDGENERYATFYNDKNEVLEVVDKEVFEEKFNVEIDEVNFPIITFEAQSDVDGRIYASDQQAKVLEDAEEYFKKK